MKSDTDPVYEQLLSANEKSRHLERQLHDKERELKRKINELNEAHKSNRELQVRIDELREEMTFQKPSSPTGNNVSLFAELDQLNEDTLKNDPTREVFQEAMDLQKSLLIDDMSPDLTLRCYRSLLNGLSNCHQQVVELKQEMWQIYQSVHFTNSILRNYIRSTKAESDLDDIDDEKEVQTPHPINLSLVMADLSNLVRKITNAKEHKANSDYDEASKSLNTRIDALIRERDEAVLAKNFMEVGLTNARLDVKSANSQLLHTIQQKVALQTELEAWQDDMEIMVQKSLTETEGMRRVNSLRYPRKSKPNQPSYRLSLFSFARNAENPYSVDSPQPSQLSHQPSVSSTGDKTTADDSEKPAGFFASWLRRRWSSTPNKTNSTTGSST